MEEVGKPSYMDHTNIWQASTCLHYVDYSICFLVSRMVASMSLALQITAVMNMGEYLCKKFDREKNPSCFRRAPCLMYNPITWSWDDWLNYVPEVRLWIKSSSGPLSRNMWRSSSLSKTSRQLLWRDSTWTFGSYRSMRMQSMVRLAGFLPPIPWKPTLGLFLRMDSKATVNA